MRKRISQREAVRNRRELRRLREFVERISGTVAYGDTHVCYLPCTDLWPREKMRGISWGAERRVVFVASAEHEEGKMRIVAVRVPEARDATR